MNQINKETNSKRKVVRLLVQVPKPCEKHFWRVAYVDWFLVPLSRCTKTLAQLQEVPKPLFLLLLFATMQEKGRTIQLLQEPVPVAPQLCSMCSVMRLSNCHSRFLRQMQQQPYLLLYIVRLDCNKMLISERWRINLKAHVQDRHNSNFCTRTARAIAMQRHHHPQNHVLSSWCHLCHQPPRCWRRLILS